MKKALKIPKFKDEDAEREYWSKLDPSQYVAEEDFESASFPNLKNTSRSTSLKDVHQSEKEFTMGKGKKLRSLRDLR